MKKLILAAFALTTAASVFAQGTINLQNRVSDPLHGFNQTGHIWGPSSTAPGLSLIGLGSNDSPAGTNAFGAASGMKLIGDTGAGLTPTGDGKYVMGYRTTFAQLIYALGSNQPESSLVPAAGVTTFRTGTTLGDVAAINSTLGVGSSDAAFASVEIVAWDNSSNAYATWAQASTAWMGGLIAGGHSAQFNVANIGGTQNGTPFLTSAGQTINGFSFNLYYIPEPSSFALAGLGAAALLIFRRRK